MSDQPFRRYSPETQCVGKLPYPSKSAAKRASRRIERHHGARPRAYRCPHHSTPSDPVFHLGHKPVPWSHEEPAAS